MLEEGKSPTATRASRRQSYGETIPAREPRSERRGKGLNASLDQALMMKRPIEESAARRLEATSIAIADMVLGHEKAR